ncbi:MAG: cytochrome B [Nitrospirae bacterium]|nr:cytochrome B [Nitrospirota bacterium]
MKKPKVAFFDFACCEGCQLQIANFGEALFDILGMIDVVEFREVMSEKWNGQLDIAFVEGSITDFHAEERIRQIRERAAILIAYGSCAAIGGVNGMKNTFDLEEIRKYVYGPEYHFFATEKTKAIPQVVKTDYVITGCPVYPPEILVVIKAALQGTSCSPPDYPVCVECKLNENVCMYDRGVACLGPVTRAGCNSWCINNGNICYGCRGMISNPNERGAREVLEKHNIPLPFVVNKMNLYNKCRE